jgi:electron transport complex protein RnfB
MLVAIIREAECVGCAKCLPACPVDAILGAPQFLHTILTDECIGCGLCIAPCPMDCIEMQESPIHDHSPLKTERAQLAKNRYQRRQKRLIQEEMPKLMAPIDEHHRVQMQGDITEAIKRVQTKRQKNEQKKL